MKSGYLLLKLSIPKATAEETVVHNSIALCANPGKVKIQYMIGVMAFQMFIVYISFVEQFFISVSIRYVVEAFQHLDKGTLAKPSRTQ